MTKVVVGSGGREHALADVISRDADVVVTPGNPIIPTRLQFLHWKLMLIFMSLT